MEGCAPKARKDAYVFDPGKSKALNLLQAVTEDKLGVYDTPNGGGNLWNKKQEAPKFSANAGSVAGYATQVGMDAASAGIDAGAGVGAALGLALINNMATQEEAMFGKFPLFFGWIPQKGQTAEDVAREIHDAILSSIKAATTEVPLWDDYVYGNVIDTSVDYEGIYSYGGGGVSGIRVVGGACDSEYYHCGFLVRTDPEKKWAVKIQEGFLPDALGGGPAWVFYAPTVSSIALTQKGNFTIGSERGPEPSLPDFAFYMAVSKHLPSNYYFFAPAKNLFSRILDADKKFLSKPLVLDHGAELRFVTPGL